MELYFYLPKPLRRNLFNIDDSTEKKIYSRVLKITNSSINERFRMAAKWRLSEFAIDCLPVEKVPIRNVSNPFRRWKRLRNQNTFELARKRVHMPDAELKKNLRADTAYIVTGFQIEDVSTFVFYQGKRAIIKKLHDKEDDWYELVIHAYMSEACKIYEHIHVPDIYFIQRNKESTETSLCMQYCKGLELLQYSEHSLMVALAHVLKALYFLQRDVHFMHRDLHSQNVWFDENTFQVTFIDFGFTCINPYLRAHAFQKFDYAWFLPLKDSHSDKCTNRSLDVCVLITSLAIYDPWCRDEVKKIKATMKREIATSQNTAAKLQFQLPKRKTQYTSITKRHWKFGNELEEKSKYSTYWLYNMIEFPLEEWYPENVLRRILLQLPLEDWWPIAQDWSTYFDQLMPHPMVRTNTNQTGMLQRVRSQTCQLQIGFKTIQVQTKDCQIIY